MDYDLSTPEGQQAYEDEARIYAAITSEAREMAPLLNQTFKVRVKGSNKAFKDLSEETFPYWASRMCGKTFEAEIAWHYKFKPVVRILVSEDFQPLLYAESLTKIGLLPKMLAAHKEAYGHLYLQCHQTLGVSQCETPNPNCIKGEL